jgi:hypothetical protein
MHLKHVRNTYKQDEKFSFTKKKLHPTYTCFTLVLDARH